MTESDAPDPAPARPHGRTDGPADRSTVPGMDDGLIRRAGADGSTVRGKAYGSGLLSDFYGMINLCRWLGIILIVGGGILWYVGKKTEGEKLKALKTSRDKKLDDRIRGIHGKVPNGKSE